MNRKAEAVRLAFRRGYRVDAQGRVVSPAGSVRVPSVGMGGYHSISLKDDDGRCVSFKAHKLAAYQKFGEASLSPGINVRHLDGNAGNNSPSNLALGTPSQNAFDKPPALRRRVAQVAARSTRSLTPQSRAELLRLREQGWSYKRLCERYGIAKSTCSYVVNRKTYNSLDAEFRARRSL